MSGVGELKPEFPGLCFLGFRFRACNFFVEALGV